jgi:hypothetical protein
MRKIAFAMVGLALLLAIPTVTLAAGAALSAATTRDGPATIIDLTGTGFEPGGSVELQVARNGEASSVQTVATDPSGGFTATFEYGPGQGGRYTFTATGPGGSATTEVVVVESAGAGVGGTRPTMPPTDATAQTSRGTADAGSGAGGVVAMLLGAAFLVSLCLGVVTLGQRARRT